MIQLVEHDYALPPVPANNLDPGLENDNANDTTLRYNSMQRNLIFTAVVIAKREQNIPPTDTSVRVAVYRRVQDLLQEPGFSVVGKTPDVRTIRSIVHTSLTPLKPLYDKSNWKKMGRPSLGRKFCTRCARRIKGNQGVRGEMNTRDSDVV